MQDYNQLLGIGKRITIYQELSVIDTIQIALPYPDLEPGRYELTITYKILIMKKLLKKYILRY